MSERLDRYLAREAFDYLEQIEGALQASERVDVERLRRLSGGVRGSARMAGLEGVEVLAGRMEAALEGVAGDGAGWSDSLAGLVAATVADLRRLVAAGERWSAAEDERARVAIARWEEAPVAQGADELDVVPVEALFPDEAGAGADVEAVVPIEWLLLGPAAALRLALAQREALREEVEALAGGDAVAAQLDELFELIEIAASGDPSRG